MGLPGRRPRPARGEVQPALARQPRDPRLRASGGGWARGLQLCRRGPELGRGVAGDAACQLLRPGLLSGCVGVRGCGRASAAPQPAPLWSAPPPPPVRSCVCSANPPPCLCCYAARARPRPTRARPRQENPPHPRGWRRRLRDTAAPPRSERNVVSAGARLRDRPQAREARGGAREVQELGEGAPSPSPSSVHGKVDRETARAGSLGTEVQGWKETGRGLS